MDVSRWSTYTSQKYMQFYHSLNSIIWCFIYKQNSQHLKSFSVLCNINEFLLCTRTNTINFLHLYILKDSFYASWNPNNIKRISELWGDHTEKCKLKYKTHKPSKLCCWGLIFFVCLFMVFFACLFVCFNKETAPVCGQSFEDWTLEPERCS